MIFIRAVILWVRWTVPSTVSQTMGKLVDVSLTYLLNGEYITPASAQKLHANAKANIMLNNRFTPPST